MNLALTNNDYKKTLRKLEYKQCCKEVLFRVGQYKHKRKQVSIHQLLIEWLSSFPQKHYVAARRTWITAWRLSTNTFSLRKGKWTGNRFAFK